MIFPGGSDGKKTAYSAGGFYSRIGKMPWRREWQPAEVFLPREFHGQRSLATNHGVAGSDMTE